MSKVRRPKPDSLDVPWQRGDGCPCGSGAIFEQCCLQDDGAPLVKIAPTVTTGDVTGYSNQRCYLNSLADCSDKITREHVISESVLKQISDQNTVLVDGLPWTDGKKAIGIASLTAKVLCDRHNSALSPLDKAAAHAFRQIRAAAEYAIKKSLARKPAFFLASGEAIERWSLKVLLGSHFAKYARSDGEILLGNFSLDLRRVIESMLGHGLESPLGLYIDPHAREVIGQQIGIAPLTHQSAKAIGGIRVNLHGITFDTLADRTHGNPEFFDNPAFHKPWVVDLNGPARTSRIILTWAEPRGRATRVAFELGVQRAQRSVVSGR